MEMLKLMATGVLRQEVRLQAMERKLENLAPVLGGVQTSQRHAALSQRSELPLKTRVTYLEEDLSNFMVKAIYDMTYVKDHLVELQRRESEDIISMHKELEDDVVDLDGKLNSSRARAHHEVGDLNRTLDKVEDEVGTNTNHYHTLRDWTYQVLHHLWMVEGKLSDEIYELNKTIGNVLKRIVELEQKKKDQGGPVVKTGGIQSSPSSMGKTEGLVRDGSRGWVPYYYTEDHANSQSADNSNSKESDTITGSQSTDDKPAVLEELLRELKNYNM